MLRTLVFEIERFARGMRFRLTRQLPTRSPYDLWPGFESTAVVCHPFSSRFGNVSQYELLLVCAVAKHVQATRLFEFGTFDGLTAWHLAVNCGPKATCWTLDLPLDHPARLVSGHDRDVGKIHGITPGEFFRSSPESLQINQLFEDSLNFNGEHLRKSIDLCFIDASHEYSHVCQDSRNALMMVK